MDERLSDRERESIATNFIYSTGRAVVEGIVGGVIAASGNRALAGPIIAAALAEGLHGAIELKKIADDNKEQEM